LLPIDNIVMTSPKTVTKVLRLVEKLNKAT
jgi:hypothetical protein